eukprot:8101238-Alexandrium_andersonii.AAC.1
MRQPTGRLRWPWQARLHAGARARCSCSTRWTSLAGRAGGAQPGGVSRRTALRPPSASRPTAG